MRFLWLKFTIDQGLVVQTLIISTNPGLTLNTTGADPESFKRGDPEVIIYEILERGDLKSLKMAFECSFQLFSYKLNCEIMICCVKRDTLGILCISVTGCRLT